MMNLGTWSKKLAAFLVCEVCATALAWRGVLTADQWLATTKALGSVYLGAQGLVDISKAIKGGG